MIKFFLDIVEQKRQRSAAMLKRNSDRNMVQVERQFSSFCRKNIGKTRLCFERIKEVPRFASRLPWDNSKVITTVHFNVSKGFNWYTHYVIINQ